MHCVLSACTTSGSAPDPGSTLETKFEPYGSATQAHRGTKQAEPIGVVFHGNHQGRAASLVALLHRRASRLGQYPGSLLVPSIWGVAEDSRPLATSPLATCILGTHHPRQLCARYLLTTHPQTPTGTRSVEGLCTTSLICLASQQ